MATIPEVPPEQRIVPVEGGRKIQIPTYAGGSVTPQETFSTPYIGGESQIALVNSITDTFNKVADQQTIVDSQARGYKEQSEAIEKGQGYVAPGATFTTAGQAYQKGARIAFVSSEIVKADGEIRKIGGDTPMDVEKFTKKSNEYKKNWMGNFSSDIQADMAFEYDKIARQQMLKIQTEKVKFDRNEQSKSIDSFTDLQLTKWTGAYLEQGPNGIGTEDPIKFLATDKQRRIESGQDADTIIDSQNRITQQIINTVTVKTLKDFYDPNSATYDPSAAKKYIDGIKNGTANLGEFGDDYAPFLPNGGVLSSKQRLAVGTILKQIDDDMTKEMAFTRHTIKQGNDNLIDDVKNGSSYVVKENNTIEFVDAKLPEKEMYNARFTTQELQEQKLKLDQANVIGKYAFEAIKSPPTQSESIIANINLTRATISANAKLSESEKNRELSVLNEAEKKVREIIDEKKKSMADQTQIEFAVKRLKFQYNPTTDEGIDAANKVLQGLFNMPQTYLPMHKGQSSVVFADLTGQTTEEGLRGRLAALRTAQPKYFEALAITGLRNSTPKETDYALVGLLDISKTGDVIEERKLANEYVNRVNFKNSHESKWGQNATKYKNDAEKAFESAYGNYIDPNTDHGKGIKQTFLLKYYAASQQFSGTNPNNNRQAIDSAQAWIDKHYPKVTFSNGTSAVVPLRVAIGEDDKIDIAKVQAAGNDMLKNPARYNIILGKDETLDDWIQDQNRIRIIYDQKQLVVRTNNNMNVTRAFQRLPSGANDIIGTDLRITLGPKQGVTTDIERTIQYNSDPKWYDQFIETNPKQKEKLALTGITGAIARQIDTKGEIISKEIVPKNIADYGIDIAAYANKTLPKNEINGKQRLFYQDSFIKQLVREGADGGINTNAYNAISLALKDGKIDNRMLQYMASTSKYLEKGLNNPAKRQVVIDEWQKNHKKYLAMKSSNDAPTQFTVLQAFAVMVGETSQNYKDYLNDQYDTLGGP